MISQNAFSYFNGKFRTGIVRFKKCNIGKVNTARHNATGSNIIVNVTLWIEDAFLRNTPLWFECFPREGWKEGSPMRRDVLKLDLLWGTGVPSVASKYRALKLTRIFIWHTRLISECLLWWVRIKSYCEVSGFIKLNTDLNSDCSSGAVYIGEILTKDVRNDGSMCFSNFRNWSVNNFLTYSYRGSDVENWNF